MSDEELLQAAKKNKPFPYFDAFFIGFLIGIIIFSATANALGFIPLIPLFLIYLFLKKPRQHQSLKKELEKRNLA